MKNLIQCEHSRFIISIVVLDVILLLCSLSIPLQEILASWGCLPKLDSIMGVIVYVF